jgi:hypothetical protein
MRRILLLICSLAFFSVFAQPAEDADVPLKVVKNFNKKFPRAGDVSWDRVDTNYKADFMFKDRLCYAEYTPEGEWQMTILDLDLYSLYSPIQAYIDNNFSKYELLFVEKISEKNRDDYYYAQLAKKVKGEKEPMIVELFFDKLGRIEQVLKPEGFNDVTIPGVDNVSDVIPDVVIASWRKRFPRAEEVTWKTVLNPSDSIDFNYVASFVNQDKHTRAEFLPSGDWVMTREKLESRNLYPPVRNYLANNYAGDNIVLAERAVRADKKDFYYVQIEKRDKGKKEPYRFELFFDKSGKITEIIRPEELKSQYLLTVDIPKEVAAKFTSRFATAREVTWEKSDSGFVSHFIYRDKPTFAEFRRDGEWISTIVEVDPSDIYAPVKRYLDQYYKDYKVSYSEKATRRDRQDYYYIELVSKKKNIEPQQTALYFDKLGRVKDKEN